MSFPPIVRPELYDRLDAARRGGGRVLLLCAAAGSGKTVAIADWIRRRSAGPATVVGWVTVTAELDRAERLWAAVCNRLSLPAAAPAHTGGFTAPDTLATNVVAALENTTVHRLLVLDDAHRITDPFALAGLEYLLGHLPASVTVIVCARFDPPVRWHALELDGRVIRLGSEQLALTAAQVRALCAQHECDLDDAELAEVMRLTRGWAGAVRITAIHLAAHRGERAAALAALAEPSVVSDFLTGELLDTLTPPLRQFLLYTCIPESFTAPLAEALAGPAARHLLRELERINFPITRTLRGNRLWLSYHPLLRSHFRDEIRYAGAELVDDLNLRAAAWFDGAHLPLAALPHLLGDGTRDRLAEFLRQRGMAIVLDGEGAALFDRIDSAGSVLADDPYIRLLRAIDALTRGDAAGALAYLAPAHGRPGVDREHIVPASWLPPLTRAALVDASVLSNAITEPPVPAPAEPVGQSDIDCYLATQRATALLLRGDREGGERQLRRGLALAATANQPLLTVRSVTRLAVAAGFAGDVTAMHERATKALGIAADHELPDSADAAQAAALAVFGAYLRGEPWREEAAAALLGTEEQSDGSIRPTAGWPSYVIGRLLAFDTAADRYAAAEALRHSMLAALERGGPFPVTVAALLPHVVWALLAVREPRTAHLLIERAHTLAGAAPEVELSRAALALGTGKASMLDTLLDPLLARDSGLGTVDRVTIWLLYAARNTAHNPHRERLALERALAHAEPHLLVRPFLDVPGAVGLLDGQAGSFGRHEDFVERIRHHPRARRATVDAQPLTATETTVLQRLPSGRTAAQIADDLGVSVNTVKTHLRGIYAKLGVNSRTAALERARRLGLL
ncbi:LuxR C-terminal-related transcriptional regulator [Nocardia sp. NPDC127526]|uniref:helix-turn-helix transcriptional regulator n=1 Tax=Nocardia sp. NPDC127526 TaxID=3345393 RepID=UPI003637CCFF